MRWRYLQLCEQNGFVPRLPKTWIHGLANRSPVLSFANLLSKRTDDEVLALERAPDCGQNRRPPEQRNYALVIYVLNFFEYAFGRGERSRL